MHAAKATSFWNISDSFLGWRNSLGFPERSLQSSPLIHHRAPPRLTLRAAAPLKAAGALQSCHLMEKSAERSMERSMLIEFPHNTDSFIFRGFNEDQARSAEGGDFTHERGQCPLLEWSGTLTYSTSPSLIAGLLETITAHVRSSSKDERGQGKAWQVTFAGTGPGSL